VLDTTGNSEVEARLDTFGIPGGKLTMPDQINLNHLFRFLEVPLRQYTLYPAQAYRPRAC
jgi:hypothetical protein